MNKIKEGGFVSYYDIEQGEGIEYISNEKNLKKIRSKNLRDFLEFYQSVHLQMINDILQGKKELPDDIIHQYKGAKIHFMMKKASQLSKSLPPDILERIDWGSAISQRTVYDYMNAVKYIKAVDKARIELTNRLQEQMVEEIKNKVIKNKKYPCQSFSAHSI